MVTIVKVRSDTDVDDVKTLINEFTDWLSERYLELEETIATYFKQQSFEEEMNNLLSVFAHPWWGSPSSTDRGSTSGYSYDERARFNGM